MISEEHIQSWYYTISFNQEIQSFLETNVEDISIPNKGVVDIESELEYKK